MDVFFSPFSTVFLAFLLVAVVLETLKREKFALLSPPRFVLFVSFFASQSRPHKLKSSSKSQHAHHAQLNFHHNGGDRRVFFLFFFFFLFF